MTIQPRAKNGLIELRRRVPKKYASVETRKEIWVSLQTDSPSMAEVHAISLWQQQIAQWEAMLAGTSVVPEVRLDAAKQLVEAKGFRYMQADVLLNQPVEDIVKRVEAISFSKGIPKVKDAEALLGVLPDPGLKISRVLELYWQLSANKMIGKSKDQVRRAKNPVIKAIKNLVDVIGDKTINSISRDDMLDFREWWNERLARQGLTSNSANKDFTHIGKVL
ncbi:MAG: hypothetical protein ACJASV_002384, partial [Pseudorhodobacter sp.]